MVALVLDGLVGFPAGLSPTSFHLSPSSFHLSCDLVPDVIHVFKEPPDACTSVVGVEPRTVGSTASGGLRAHIHTDKDHVCKSFVDGVLNALCKGDGPFHVV